MSSAASSPSVAPGLQLTWCEGALLAWNPSAGIRGGNLGGRLARFGLEPRMAVRRIETPGGPLSVMCQVIDPASFIALGRFDDHPSPSMAWFAEVARTADHIVTHRRAVASLASTGPERWRAGWRAAQADLQVTQALISAMPSVCAGASPLAPAALMVEILDCFVDVRMRQHLLQHGWDHGVTDTRTPRARALRLVTSALTHRPDIGIAPGDPVGGALDELGQRLSRMGHRADGLPVIAARVRLDLPDIANGSWPLTWELVDLDDRSRWCTAAQLDRRSAEARQLVTEEAHLGVLDTALDVAYERGFAALDLLGADSVDIDGAAAVIEAADRLAEVDIEVLVPQQLTRARPSVRAKASPKGESKGRFTAAALLTWSVTVDDVEIDEATLVRAAAAGTALIEAGGRWVRLDGSAVRRALSSVNEHRAEHGELDPLALLRLSAELAAELEADAPADAATPAAAILGDGWLGDLLAGLPDTSLADGDVPASFMATLRPYQRRGLGWLQFLRRLGLGGCLADDMGLGKTPTTLAHLVGIDGPHLVLCPLSVVRNWQNEAARFTPLLRPLVLHGPGRPKGAALVRAVASADLVITTYQSAVRDVDTLAEIHWSTLVLDEAQAIKNHETHAARAVRGIAADQRIALTGTPVENRLAELWSIIDVVAPGLLGNHAGFRRRFATPIERHGDAAAIAELRQLTGPFLLRRTKADKALVPDLPDKVEQIAWAGLTKEQATMYQAVVDQLLADAEAASGMKRRGLVLAALTRLKQICNHPAHALGDHSRLGGRSSKLARFDELVDDLLDAGERALVFTQFREMGLLLARHLHERLALDTPFLHGGVSRTGRDMMVKRFQDGEGSPLLLVSLKAGGTGLNLTAASRVVHYDRWWNPAVEDQATDRAWRIGQSRSVFVHKLVCQGTVEERVAQLIDDKRALADAVVGTSGEQWLTELSTDALRDLVTLDVHAARST